MDFPFENITPTHLNTELNIFGGQVLRTVAAATGPAAFTWAAANQAFYYPITLPWPYFAQRAFWINGSTATSNVDIGVYSVGGTRIWSAGSTAQSGASAVQYVTITNGLYLNPGRYYLAFALSATTSRAYGRLISTILAHGTGAMTQTSALPLPATATFATVGSSMSCEFCGLTRLASGF